MSRMVANSEKKCRPEGSNLPEIKRKYGKIFSGYIYYIGKASRKTKILDNIF